MRIVDRKEVGAALEAFCDKFETYKEAAKKLGITLSQLSAARNKPKSVVPAKALKKLGFEFKAVYLAKDLPPAKKHVPSAITRALVAASKAKPRKAKGPTARHGPNADDAVRDALKAAKPRVRKPKPAPPMRDIAGGMTRDPYLEGIDNRNAVDNSVIESVVDVSVDSPDMADLRDNLYADNEPENPDIYIPDDNGDNITIN
jgi:hypothetical protein